MTRLMSFVIIMLVACLEALAQYNSYRIPAPQGPTSEMRLVDYMMVDRNEFFALFTDRASEQEQRLMRYVNSNWEEIPLSNNERFFAARPSGWIPISLNRVASDSLILKGWDRCFDANCGGVYRLHRGNLEPLVLPNKFYLFRENGAVRTEQVRRIGVANPTPDSTAVTVQIATGDKNYLIKVTFGFSEFEVLGRDLQGIDYDTGVYVSPATGAFTAVFRDQFATGNPIRSGQLIEGRFKATGIIESPRTSYDVSSGERFVNDRGGYVRPVGQGVVRKIPSTALLATTVSGSFFPYGARSSSEAPISAVVNALDGQVLVEPQGLETLVPPVALSPASTSRCSTVVPLFRPQGGTVIGGQLLKGVDQNTLVGFQVVQKMDCQ